MFTSKTPRDLNNDPEPWRGHFSGHRWAHEPRDYVTHYEPRPEFDAVQHNEPNPILVAFRERGDAEFPESWIAALDARDAFGGFREWDVPQSYFHPLTKATTHQVQHARRVLTRLPALR